MARATPSSALPLTPYIPDSLPGAARSYWFATGPAGRDPLPRDLHAARRLPVQMRAARRVGNGRPNHRSAVAENRRDGACPVSTSTARKEKKIYDFDDPPCSPIVVTARQGLLDAGERTL